MLDGSDKVKDMVDFKDLPKHEQDKWLFYILSAALMQVGTMLIHGYKKELKSAKVARERDVTSPTTPLDMQIQLGSGNFVTLIREMITWQNMGRKPTPNMVMPDTTELRLVTETMAELLIKSFGDDEVD